MEKRESRFFLVIMVLRKWVIIKQSRNKSQYLPMSGTGVRFFQGFLTFTFVQLCAFDPCGNLNSFPHTLHFHLFATAKPTASG